MALTPEQIKEVISKCAEVLEGAGRPGNTAQLQQILDTQYKGREGELLIYLQRKYPPGQKKSSLAAEAPPEASEKKPVIPPGAMQPAVNERGTMRLTMVMWLSYFMHVKKHEKMEKRRKADTMALAIRGKKLAVQLIKTQVMANREAEKAKKEIRQLTETKSKIEKFIGDLLDENMRLKDASSKLQTRCLALEADKDAKYGTLKSSAENATQHMRKLAEELREKEAHIFRLEGRLMRGGNDTQVLRDQIEALQTQLAHCTLTKDNEIEALQIKLNGALLEKKNALEGMGPETHAAQSNVDVDPNAVLCKQRVTVLEDQLALITAQAHALQQSLRDAEARADASHVNFQKEKKRADELEEENSILYGRLGAAREHAAAIETELSKHEGGQGKSSTRNNLMMPMTARPEGSNENSDRKARSHLDLLKALLERHNTEEHDGSLSMHSFFAKEANQAERRHMYGHRTAERGLSRPMDSTTPPPMSSPLGLVWSRPLDTHFSIETANPKSSIFSMDSSVHTQHGVRPKLFSFTHDDRVTSSPVGSTKDRRDYLFSFPNRGSVNPGQ